MIRLPVDASQNVQAAFRDVEQELETLKAAVAALSGGTDLTAVHERIDRIQPPPQLDSDKFVFVGSGPQHSVGLVPDPGETPGNKFLKEDGTWAESTGLEALAEDEQSERGIDDVYQVPGSLHVTGSLSAGLYTGNVDAPMFVRARGGEDGQLATDPTAVSGLTGWWKADAEVYANDAAVATFNDQSGAGRDFAQATEANKPLFKTNVVNGYPVLRFDGTNDHMLTSATTTDFIDAGTGTIFIVAHPTTITTDDAVNPYNNDAILYDAGSYLGMAVATSDERFIAVNHAGGVHNQAVKTTSMTDGFHIFTWMHGGGTVYGGVDDTRTASLASTAAGNTTTITSVWRIGANYNAGVFTAVDIAEIIAFDEALTESDRQGIETYLSQKYSIDLPYATTGYSDSDLVKIEDDSGNVAFRIDKNGFVYVRGSNTASL